ncbi:MAG: hypothetical protein FWG68_12900 [Defluviitaleaceae bacterium]|nr:hypothetical protein [Defluviitaleaceae bacterium]
MFSFDGEHEILEHDVIIEDMEDKYPDKFMIAVSRPSTDSRIHGDVLAILTPAEYSKIKFPKPMPRGYSVWVGISLQMDDTHNTDFLLYKWALADEMYQKHQQKLEKG